MSRDRSRELEVAREAVELAGRFALGHFGRDLEVERKADASPVTAADQAAEASILSALGRVAPQFPVVAEEAVAAGSVNTNVTRSCVALPFTLNVCSYDWPVVRPLVFSTSLTMSWRLSPVK